MSLQRPVDRPPAQLPRGQDLPDTDGKPMDSDWVADQTRLYLIEPLRLYLAEQGRPAYVSGDSFVYYLPAQGRKVRRLGPDFYVVMGGQSQGQTKWVSWEEGGLLPTTVIEFVSPSTESRDRGQKFCTYRDVFQTEDYFIVKPETLKLEGFHLSHGHYVALQGQPDGWFWVNSLGLWLGPLDGWLRLRTPDGQLLATGRELADQERERADQERERADQERQRAEQAEARLSQLEEQLRRLQSQ